MFTRFRSAGFILKKENRSDSDQLFTIYTENFGKLEILARSIRKIFSKLRSGADIFYLSDIEFIQGRNRQTLIEAIPINKFISLRSDPGRLEIAQEIAQTLDSLIIGQEPDEKIWQLLNEVFRRLDAPEIGNLEILYQYFFWNFVSDLGYGPELKEMGPELIKLLRLILKKDWPTLSKLKIEEGYIKDLRIACENSLSL